MEIRPAEPADRAEIAAIYDDAVRNTTATFDTEPLTEAQWDAWFARFDAEHPLLVAVVDDAVAGYAYYVPYRPKAAYARTKELTVYVAEAHRGRGVAGALYSALIQRAHGAGVHALVAVIAGDNPASEALHRRFGFAPVGRLREVGFKFGGWVDTCYWIMHL